MMKTLPSIESLFSSLQEFNTDTAEEFCLGTDCEEEERELCFDHYDR